MNPAKTYAVKLGCLLLMLIPSSAVYAHAVSFWGMRPLEWRNEQFSQVVPFAGDGQKVSVQGKECLSGGNLHFNIRDDYAFDIDEPVWLDLELYIETGASKLSVVYDRSDVAPITMMGGEPDAR